MRALACELIDDPEVDPAEVDRNLGDLARLNRLPGGTAASVAAIRRLVPGRNARVLDVGAGGADMAIAFADHEWATVAVDSHPKVLSVARAAASQQRLVEVMEADARALPFADRQFDVAHSSLLLHHLEPHDSVEALREMARVTRSGVVINDLRRSLLAFVMAAPLVLGLSRSSMTRHDGLLSLRRAYTLDELDQMLDEAGLRVVWRSSRFLPRVVTAAVPKNDS